MWCSGSLPTSSLCDAVQRVSVHQAEHGHRHFTTRRTGLSVNEGSHATLLDKKKLESQLGQALVPEVVDIPRDASSDASGEANIHLPGYLAVLGKARAASFPRAAMARRSWPSRRAVRREGAGRSPEGARSFPLFGALG